MKILVTQLTRLGDIFQTWPVLRAIQRNHPDAEIYFLIRSRFAAAAEGLEGVHVRVIDFKDILTPLIQVEPAVEGSMNRLRTVLDELVALKFDRVINLTFSPFTAYLCSWLDQKGVGAVQGYSRHLDGTLKFGEDFSKYFYAQGGRDRWSRIHLTRLFAGVAGVDLDAQDWRPPTYIQPGHRSGIALQIAGSEAHKSVGDIVWISIIRELRKFYQGSIVLLGSETEKSVAERIENSLPEGSVVNRVGQTSIKEVFQIIAQSELAIAPDSMGLHVATLTQTPIINLSAKSVNFHETGPLSEVSIILTFAEDSDLSSARVSEAVRAILSGNPAEFKFGWKRRSKFLEGPECYERATSERPDTLETMKDFQWSICEGLYFEGRLEKEAPENFVQALVELFEMNEVVLDCLTRMSEGAAPQKFSAILDRSDEVLQAISQIVPAVGPLVRKVYSDKCSIAPSDLHGIIENTRKAHEVFRDEVNALWSIYNKEEVLEAP